MSEGNPHSYCSNSGGNYCGLNVIIAGNIVQSGYSAANGCGSAPDGIAGGCTGISVQNCPPAS
jgi:hypothetical protein